MRLGGPSARTMCPFSLFWRSTVGLFQLPVDARCSRLHWLNVKISHEGSLPVRPFVRYQRVAAGGVDGELRGGPPCRASAISRE